MTTEQTGEQTQADGEPPCLLCGGRRFTDMWVPGHECLWRQCRDCGLWRNTTPLARGAAEHYDADYQENHYGAASRRKLRTARLLVQQLEGLLPPGKLLDVGCSLGYLLQAAAARGWDAWGVDVNEQVVRQDRERGLQVEVAGMGALPFADGTFEVVQARHVLEHDPAVAHNLAEMRRVLKPGGLLVIEVPDCASPKVVRRGAGYSRFWVPDHMVGFTPQTLEAFARQAGLEPLVLGPFTGLRLSASLVSFSLWRLADLIQKTLGQSKAFASVWIKTQP